ncbi:YbaB/EbfC family nucleoid-associated protein [Pacificimonas flava]|uniref:Nucleoid-associated protein C725_1534 n=1 Tax=Pacificimonas flava TaxID=1234595 RepID=M2TMI7_9SPHN|nr:YbaB/EbfC family nucleoid-associated protein [Pacificimonas flava]EMD82936.1 hypothetical protein C725_1534 [Pacificimonas flava]MBB5280097.1 hypothetical protein [Pacificimonas flava]
MNNIEDIMKAAQGVQEEMNKAQAKLDTMEVTGEAGGGLVTVRATAKGRILGVSIDESLMTPGDKEMVEDLVTAAFNDARGKADAKSAEELGKMTSGLPLPPGFKLPF